MHDPQDPQTGPSDQPVTDGATQHDTAGYGEDGSVGYRGVTACHAVGISYRQLDYWARTDLVRPSLADANGSGSRRRYSYRDLLELKMIKKLLDAGIRLEQVREVFANLRRTLDDDIASANLVISGNQVALCQEGEIVDLLRRGQGVLSFVLSLDGVRQELDAHLVELFPAEETSALPRVAGG